MAQDANLNHRVTAVEPSECPPAPAPAVLAPTPPGSAPGAASEAGREYCHQCLSAMAHRLAQSITALRGALELGLLGKRSAADYRSVLEQALELADQMVQLIVSLRDLGESGAGAGPPQRISLKDTMMEVQQAVAGLAEVHELGLACEVEDAPQVSANPLRLREALESLLAWIIHNSAGGGVIGMRLSAREKEAFLSLSPPRLDLQYLQIKVLEDITNPGVLFAQAAQQGALGWAIIKRLVEALGGKLEMLAAGPSAEGIRLRLPLAPP